MENRDDAVLKKLLQETTIISDMIKGFAYDDFINDEKTKRAVCMTLINIGEMVKLISEELKAANAEIPWRSIAGLRDVTAHGYQTLRMDDIWETVATDVPVLRNQIEKLLKR
jgi:uncharacterized protein with HEPN domain